MTRYMPKYRKNCITCRAAKKDAKLRDRIYRATYHKEVGDESLRDIALEVPVSAVAMYNHARKHLADREPRPETKQLKIEKKTAEIKAAVHKKHELSIDHEEISSDLESVEALKEYIRQGYSMVKEGKINITPQSFLQAIRIDIDYESKKQDRQVDIIKTMMRFASGESKETNVKPKPVAGETEGAETPPVFTGSPDPGTGQPGDIHPEDARNALTQWANQVPQTDAEKKDPYQLADVLQPLGEINPDSLPAPVASVLQDRSTGG